MGWLDSFLHPEKGYEKAQNQLDQYYNQGQGFLQPYSQFGQNAYGDYSGAMKSLLDPAALQAQWSKSYSESPEAKYAMDMAQQHGLDAASGLGLMGSNTALNAIQGGTSQIGLQDRQNYLNDLMQKYLTGTGIAGNIFNMGGNTANSMSNNAMNMGQNSAQMAYNKQAAPGSIFGGLLGLGAGLAGSAFGGPIGGALGAGLAQHMGWSPTGSYNPSGGS